MLPASLLFESVRVYRRNSQGRDSLNNPNYGAPTTGVGWVLIYQQMPARIALSSRPIQFAKEGERVQPNGVAYYNTDYTLQADDRIVTNDTGIEYVVTSVVAARVTANVIDHYEALINLP